MFYSLASTGLLYKSDDDVEMMFDPLGSACLTLTVCREAPPDAGGIPYIRARRPAMMPGHRRDMLAAVSRPGAIGKDRASPKDCVSPVPRRPPAGSAGVGAKSASLWSKLRFDGSAVCVYLFVSTRLCGV